jgi:hypothetical protein
MSKFRLRDFLFVGAGMLLQLAAGCTSSSQTSTQSNLAILAKNYGMYQAQNQGQTPPDEKKFKEFIQKQDPAAKVDELFTSPRDGQPYVILYGKKAAVPDPQKGMPIVAYEKVGVGGKRLVARSTTQVEEVDDAKLREWVPNP